MTAAWKLPPALTILFHFVVHIVVAALLFCIIAIVASAMWFGTQHLHAFGAPYEIWVVCELVSELLFAIDVICFGFFAVMEARKLVLEIWRGRNN